MVDTITWEWDGKEDKLSLLLRLISHMQYTDSVGCVCVNLAQEIQESLKQED